MRGDKFKIVLYLEEIRLSGLPLKHNQQQGHTAHMIDVSALDGHPFPKAYYNLVEQNLFSSLILLRITITSF